MFVYALERHATLPQWPCWHARGHPLHRTDAACCPTLLLHLQENDLTLCQGETVPFRAHSAKCRHNTSASSCHFQHRSWEIGSASAERAGQGRWVGAPGGCKQHGGVWALRKKGLGAVWPCRASISSIGLFFSYSGLPFLGRLDCKLVDWWAWLRHV